MEILWTGLKALKVWQYLVMVAVLIGAVGGTYGAYAVVTGSGGQELEDNQQLIPVQFGNLVNQVTTNGSLVFPNRETLTFGTAGTVVEVLVEESQQVAEGQALARLDETTVASLNRAVAQARVNLQDSLDALDRLENPPGLDLALARSAVADAELQLQKTRDTLAGARQPYTQQEIKQQENLVANARLTLRDADQSLVDFAPEHSRQLTQARQAESAAEIAEFEASGVRDAFDQDHAQQLAQARQTKADAEVALARAQEDLTSFSPDYDRQLVQAIQGNADAEVALARAEEALASFTPDYEESLAQARRRNADAEVALQGAQEALTDFGLAYDLLLAGAPQTQLDAEIGLVQALAALDQYELANSAVLDTNRLGKIEAQTALDRAQAILDSLLASRESGLGGLDPHIEQAQATVELRRADLAAAQPLVAEVELLEAALVLAQTNLETAKDDLAALETGPDPLRLQQLQAAVAVAQAGLEQTQTDLAGLEAGPDLLQIQQLEAAVVLAESNLDLTKAVIAELGPADTPDNTLDAAQSAGLQDDSSLTEQSLAAIIAGADPLELASREARLASAIANLAEAQQDLSQLEAGPDPLELAFREARLASASADLTEAQQKLSLLEVGPDSLDLASREAAVALAGEALSQAEIDLGDMLLGADPTEVASKEEQVAVAQAALAEADEALAELLGDPDLLQLGLNKAELAAAQLALEKAVSRRENATLRAPMAGFISLVNVEAGDDVGPNTAIIEVVDPTVMEVDGIVDEIDVRLVQVGAQAAVSLDAFPGQTLEGTVSAIAPAAQNQQGVVTYPIRILMNVPDGMQLREGLSATANIILLQESNVLLVPQQALYGSFDAPVVRVMTSSGVEERPVVLGNSDDFWTVVTQGLAEGDQVVMEVSQTTSDPFAAFRQLREGFGGGGGRGGFGGGGGGFGGGRPAGGAGGGGGGR